MIQKIMIQKENIKNFISSDAFRSLLNLYGYSQEQKSDLLDELNTLVMFSAKTWDFRARHAGAERSSIDAKDADAVVDFEQTKRLLDQMGMMRTPDLSEYPVCDYLLPLGGRADSNRTRVILAQDALKNFKDREPEHKITVCALSAERLLQDEKETAVVAKFAPGAKSEFDAITGGMKSIFALSEPKVQCEEDTDNVNSSWRLAKFDSAEDTEFYTMSAPSSQPDSRRSNTLDTFEHFLNIMNVPEGSRILLCSTAIYGEYQLFSLMPSAMEHGVELYFAGRPSDPVKMPKTFVPNVLQEVNSALRAMKAFMECYPDHPQTADADPADL